MSRRRFLGRLGLATGVVLGGAACGTVGDTAGSRGDTAPRSASAGNDIVAAEATELARMIGSRQVSCREVMQAYLAQIDRLNPKVNAIVSRQDPDALLKQADERDRQLAAGERLGWMHGFPQAPKDLAATAGIVTTSGSPIFKSYVPKADAIIVERVRKAGAILIGKTNTPEFGLGSQTYNPVFGATSNPYDATKTSGGSSGGAAAALALHMLPVADGSDMAGSLRNPAGFCNVVGFRPSQGRVPYGPTNEVFMQQLGYEGPMARTVADLAMLLSTQAGFDERIPLSLDQDPAVFARPLKRDFKDVRVGWLGDFGGYLPMEPGMLDLCRGALSGFTAAGCVVEEAKIDYPMQRVWQTWLTLRQFLIAGIAKPLYDNPQMRGQMKPEAIWEIESGLKLSGLDVFDASVARSAWYQAVRQAFQKWDYLVLPTAQVFPFDVATHWPKTVAGKPMDTYHRWMEVVVPITLSGCPAIGVPAGFNSAGLPAGVQIVGKAQRDLAVLQLAYAYEQATAWVRKRKPPMLAAA